MPKYITVQARPGKRLRVAQVTVTDAPVQVPNTVLVREHLRLGRLLAAEVPAPAPAPQTKIRKDK